MTAPLLLLAACGAAVGARDLGGLARTSLRGARVGASQRASLAATNDGPKDEPPTTTEMMVNATEGKPFKFLEEMLTRMEMMPEEAKCNGFFMEWKVEGKEGGKEQGFCQINDFLAPFVLFFLFAVQFTTWFAVCRKRRRSVKGPYPKTNSEHIGAIDPRPGQGQSLLLWEMLWWWFMCIDDLRGPLPTIKAVGNIFESWCCFCWMHADTMTRSGMSTNLSAYGTGCLMCLGPGPLFPCFWASSWIRKGTRAQILAKTEHVPGSGGEQHGYTPQWGGVLDFLLHCFCAPFVVRQEAELVELHHSFEFGRGPEQQSMKGKGGGKPQRALTAPAGKPAGGKGKGKK